VYILFLPLAQREEHRQVAVFFFASTLWEMEAERACLTDLLFGTSVGTNPYRRNITYGASKFEQMRLVLESPRSRVVGHFL
jgi:hypothetical protein